MAIAIKSIPVLEGNVARSFTSMAVEGYANKSTVDFSRQVSIASKILEKAGL